MNPWDLSAAEAINALANPSHPYWGNNNNSMSSTSGSTRGQANYGGSSYSYTPAVYNTPYLSDNQELRDGVLSSWASSGATYNNQGLGMSPTDSRSSYFQDRLTTSYLKNMLQAFPNAQVRTGKAGDAWVPTADFKTAAAGLRNRFENPEKTASEQNRFKNTSSLAYLDAYEKAGNYQNAYEFNQQKQQRQQTDRSRQDTAWKNEQYLQTNKVKNAQDLQGKMAAQDYYDRSFARNQALGYDYSMAREMARRETQKQYGNIQSGLIGEREDSFKRQQDYRYGTEAGILGAKTQYNQSYNQGRLQTEEGLQGIRTDALRQQTGIRGSEFDRQQAARIDYKERYPYMPKSSKFNDWDTPEERTRARQLQSAQNTAQNPYTQPNSYGAIDSLWGASDPSWLYGNSKKKLPR